MSTQEQQQQQQQQQQQHHQIMTQPQPQQRQRQRQTLVLETDFGTISLGLLPELAPETVAHIVHLVEQVHLYNPCSFYRSDFVLQLGVHGTGKERSVKPLQVNETPRQTSLGNSNSRGTVSIAHFDVPDCGSTEMFINLQDNAHLDYAYGGYCVFARVQDQPSLALVDKIAVMIKERQPVRIHHASIIR